MTFRELLEELSDIPAVGKNIHYTNIEALYYIMKDGKIKGMVYNIASNKAVKDNKKEIATIRSSATYEVENSNKDFNLSDNIDNVKITLFTDRILAGVRNAKVDTIAEYPKTNINHSERIRKGIKEKFGITLPKDVSKYINRKTGELDLSPELFTSNKDPMFVMHFKYWKGAKESEFKETENGSKKEKEERIVVGKNGIPLDPRFLQIEFIKNPSKNYLEFFDTTLGNEADKKVAATLCKNFLINYKKHEKCFIKNKYLTDFLKQLKYNLKEIKTNDNI